MKLTKVEKDVYKEAGYRERTVDHIVQALVKNYEKHDSMVKINSMTQPNRQVIEDIIHELQKLIFPGFFEAKHLKSETISYYVGELVEDIRYNLEKQIVKAYRCVTPLESLNEMEIRAKTDLQCKMFLERLPYVQDLLETDVQASYDGDPAAYSTDEIIYSYPGLYAIMVYRLAHVLHELDVPLIPRIMTEHAHSETGIDIHPGAQIGEHFFIDHGTGIVIGETTVIGRNVKVYQGVTLGGLSTSGGQSLKGQKRHPTIEDNVTIYSGASILGGNTVIGEGALIGGNSFVTRSVPAHARVIADCESRLEEEL